MKNYLLILIIAFLLPNFLIGQEDSTKVDDMSDLLDLSLGDLMNIEVSGVSRYAQNLSDVPNSIQVISQQQIADRGYNDLSDLLKDVQGFDITSNAGQFGEFYSFRGIAGNDRFLVLVNGHKLNPASGTYISIGNSISIRYAERIEIISGPASAVYGADAFSGIINIVFKDIASEDKNTNISGYINYGSLNTIDGAFNASVKVNNDFSINTSARIYKSDGPNFIGTDSKYYDYDLIKDYPSPLTDNFEQPTFDHNIYFNAKYKNFSINYFRQQFDEGNALSFDPLIYIYNKDNKWKTSTDIFWADYEIKFNNDGNLKFDVSYKRHIQDNNTIYYKWNIPGVFDADETYKQFMTGKDNSIQAVLTYNQLISDKFQFIAGIENEYTTSVPPYANDEVLGYSSKYEGENAKQIDEELTITENRVSGFGQFVYSPIKYINITFGARYDYSTRYKGVFNPRAGIIISPTNSTKIKFIYGRAFQSPSLFVQYEQWGAPDIAFISTAEIRNRDIDPNWELKNQIVNSYEASLTQKIGKNLEFKIGAFYNDLTNLIERNLFAAYPVDSVYNKYFDNYTSGLRNENIGSQKIIGGDFSLNAKISKNIILYTYYSYTDAVSVLNNGDETKIPRIADHKVWIGVTAQNLFNYLTISPRLRWSSDMYNANATIFSDNIQPGFYTLDLNLSVNNLSKYFRIYANFENITDEKQEHGGLYDQTGVYTAVIPQQGFTFRAGIEVFFNK
ncbi:MAG: TonB-dependent receptor [Bacteroidales bacterium]|nr:TonB-dependent receptor [Bacteroidales bacterium]